jgi:hypothetical protein
LDGDLDEIKAEMTMLYELRHPGVAAFFGICINEGVVVRRR